MVPTNETDVAKHTATVKVDISCAGTTVTMKQTFSEVDNCSQPALQIPTLPNAGGASVTVSRTCKVAASGKTRLEASASATDPTGAISFNGTQSSQGSAAPGASATLKSTTTVKPTIPLARGAARQEEASLDFSNDASVATGGSSGLSVGTFLGANAGFDPPAS